MAFPKDRAKVRGTLLDVTEECRRLYSQGAHQEARRLAANTSFELSAVLGPYPPPAEDLSHLGSVRSLGPS